MTDVIELLQSYDLYSENKNKIEIQKHCRDTCKHRVNIDVKVLSWWGWLNNYQLPRGEFLLRADQIETLFWASGIQTPPHFIGAISRSKYVPGPIHKRAGKAVRSIRSD